jgi:hypothetical protein
MNNSNYQIISVLKGYTINNSKYYTVDGIKKDTNETFRAYYFGNTKPKQIISLTKHISKSGDEYLIAQIQPHQCRDKKGRFTSQFR